MGLPSGLTMSHTVSNVQPISSAHTVKQYAGFGILGADIPTTGDNGGSPVLNDGILDTSEYYWRLETPPSAGSVTIYPDLSYLFSGAADGTWPWAYRLFWVDSDGTTGNGTATVTDTFGSGSIALAIADSVHAHTTDAVGLTTQWLLSVSDPLHAHVADNMALSATGSASLVVQQASHAHIADGITITTNWLLSVANAAHSHATDNLLLDISNAISLTVQDAAHTNTADSPTLTAEAILQIAESLHAHFADTLVLSQPQSGGACPTAEEIAAAVWAYTNRVITGPTAEQNADALLSRTWP